MLDVGARGGRASDGGCGSMLDGHSRLAALRFGSFESQYCMVRSIGAL